VDFKQLRLQNSHRFSHANTDSGSYTNSHTYAYSNAFANSKTVSHSHTHTDCYSDWRGGDGEPSTGIILYSSSVTFNWSSGGTQTYFLLVGSVPSGVDIIQIRPSAGALSATVNNIPTDGRTVYVTLGSWINGSWTHNNYTYKAP